MINGAGGSRFPRNDADGKRRISAFIRIAEAARPREAERPLSVGEIAAHILAAKGREEARTVIRRRVTTNLAYTTRSGEIVTGGEEGGPAWQTFQRTNLVNARL